VTTSLEVPVTVTLDGGRIVGNIHCTIPRFRGLSRGVGRVVLRPINKAQPLRIARKREAFRRSPPRLHQLEQRSELLAASLFAHAASRSSSAKDHRTLCSRRRLGHRGRFAMRSTTHGRSMRNQASDRRPHRSFQIILTFDGRPLHLGSGRVVEIAEEVAAVARRGPEVSASTPVGLTDRIGAAPVRLCACFDERPAAHSELKDHMSEIGRRSTTRSTRSDAKRRRCRTGALVDISRGRRRLPSTCRPSGRDVLKEKLKDESASYAGLGVMIQLTQSMVADAAESRYQR